MDEYQLQAFSSKTMNGALTYTLIDVVRANPNVTYVELLDKIQARIAKANERGCVGGPRILSRIFGPNITQVFYYPQPLRNGKGFYEIMAVTSFVSFFLMSVFLFFKKIKFK